MSFTNFKIENDSEGIAVVTWDSPGRSMNVIDAKVMDELSAIIDQTTADAVYLEIGSRSKHERVEYPDVDLLAVRDDNGWRFTRKNGDPYG